MSMWSRLKVAALSAALAVTALLLGGCGLNLSWDKILPYVAIGSIFD